MKKKYLIFVLVLIIFSWPFYYLYQRQLGAIPFLLIAVFFFYITVRDIRRLKRKEPSEKKEKSNQNNR